VCVRACLVFVYACVCACVRGWVGVCYECLCLVFVGVGFVYVCVCVCAGVCGCGGVRDGAGKSLDGTLLFSSDCLVHPARDSRCSTREHRLKQCHSQSVMVPPHPAHAPPFGTTRTHKHAHARRACCRPAPADCVVELLLRRRRRRLCAFRRLRNTTAGTLRALASTGGEKRPVTVSESTASRSSEICVT
jgi:hypothetical protein